MTYPFAFAPPEGEEEPLDPLARAAVDEVIRANAKGIQTCYERELVRDRTLAGELAIRFVIEADGTARRATLERSNLDNRAFESCVLERIRELEFPPPEGGGNVIVTYPFVFASADAVRRGERPADVEGPPDADRVEVASSIGRNGAGSAAAAKRAIVAVLPRIDGCVGHFGGPDLEQTVELGALVTHGRGLRRVRAVHGTNSAELDACIAGVLEGLPLSGRMSFKTDVAIELALDVQDP